MPNLPNIKFGTLLKFFLQKGFTVDHITGSHYILYHRETRKRAVLSYRKGDFPKGTLLAIIRESGFTKEDLTDFLYKH